MDDRDRSQDVDQSAEVIDVQFGCCQLNKKLLLKSLDSLAPGGEIGILAENSDVMKEMVRKYAREKGCVITGISDQNGTSLIKLKKN
ncbi:MAG: hypothetical protein HZB33_07555 [Nitrospirae bacterium]|nr:hypothetical protein [Nitrospirota bacterium]